MTEKQRRFADEYLIDCNATQAAIRAGYSPKTANEQGNRLLANVSIKAYIDEQLAGLHHRNIADAKEVLEYLTSVVRGESTEDVPILCGDGYQKLIPKEVGTKDRLKAAELLGKHLGMFTDQLRVSGDMGVQIIDDIPNGTDKPD